MATEKTTEPEQEYTPSAAIDMDDIPSNVKEVVENEGYNLDDFFAVPYKDVDALYSQRFCKSQMGADSLFDPLFSRQGGASSTTLSEEDQRITGLNAVHEWLTSLEWLESAVMPRGVPACWTTPESAFRQGWKFVEDRETGTRLEDQELLERLKKIDKKWKIRAVVPTAAQVSAVWGRALIYRTQLSRLGRKKRWELRVIPIEEEYIIYNDNNEIIEFRPIVRWGRGEKQVSIKPTDAVLFIRAKDPLGNSYSGIPAHAFAFKTIIRGELMTKSYTNLIVNRGLGVMLVGITAGTPDTGELNKYAQMVGDPGSRSIIFYPKNLFEIDVKEGMKAGFSFSDVDDRLSKHLSMSTNLPQMKMEGVQSGAVTGSETDQDNTAENYIVEQGYHHDSIIDLYVMIDPTLEDEDGIAPFELIFPFDIKLDKKKQSEIFQMESASVTMVEDAITLGEVRDRLGYSAFENDEDNKKIYSVYINDLRKEHGMGENEDIEDAETGALNMQDKRGTKAAKTKDIDSLLKVGFSKRDVLNILKAIHGKAVSMSDVKEIEEEVT